MSSPQTVTCLSCHKPFIFLRGALESCPECGAEYKSHRDETGEANQEEKGCDHCRGFEDKMASDAGLRHDLRNNRVVCGECGREIRDMLAPTAHV